ncbi:hypothetical protein AN958_09583 [Leucoagaricus sp. SymC.cos]|nr:hypothetical protein AN958_09583 [Leucoagaricus sp. SymC.cos]
MYFPSFSSGILAVLIASTYAAPAAIHTVETFAGEKTGRLLVTLKSGVTRSSFLNEFRENATITHEWDLINGFAAHLDGDTLNALRANPDVQSIAEDGIAYATVTQTNAPWGLSRLSSMSKIANQDYSALTNSYTYDASAGAGVDIYIIVTIRRTCTLGNYFWDADVNGHGTHCAGIAGGSQFGVAKAASLVAVRVLADNGGGAAADIVSGMDWVAQQFVSTGRPAVASLSLAGQASTTLDNAVAALASAGVHVVVAAGNEGYDACNDSPARTPSAITVGGSTILDSRAAWSNFGSCVDIFAPGSSVISAWIGSPNATESLTGTSMATPHVSGLIAYLIGLKGNMSPADMTNLLKSISLQDILAGIYTGTVNILAHNGNGTASF